MNVDTNPAVRPARNQTDLRDRIAFNCSADTSLSIQSRQAIDRFYPTPEIKKNENIYAACAVATLAATGMDQQQQHNTGIAVRIALKTVLHTLNHSVTPALKQQTDHYRSDVKRHLRNIYNTGMQAAFTAGKNEKNQFISALASKTHFDNMAYNAAGTVCHSFRANVIKKYHINQSDIGTLNDSVTRSVQKMRHASIIGGTHTSFGALALSSLAAAGFDDTTQRTAVAAVLFIESPNPRSYTPIVSMQNVCIKYQQMRQFIPPNLRPDVEKAAELSLATLLTPSFNTLKVYEAGISTANGHEVRLNAVILNALAIPLTDTLLEDAVTRYTFETAYHTMNFYYELQETQIHLAMPQIHYNLEDESIVQNAGRLLKSHWAENNFTDYEQNLIDCSVTQAVLHDISTRENVIENYLDFILRANYFSQELNFGITEPLALKYACINYIALQYDGVCTHQIAATCALHKMATDAELTKLDTIFLRIRYSGVNVTETAFDIENELDAENNNRELQPPPAQRRRLN